MRYFVIFLALCGLSQAQTFTVLHSFPYQQPSGQLAMDASGNLYGTTYEGGKFNDGAIFELIPQPGGKWKHVGLYSFAGGKKGWTPLAGLTADGKGNFYGTTAGEGTVDGQGSVIFRMSSVNGKWTVKILAQLVGLPASGPVAIDVNGNLYGTSGGGAYGSGAVFELPAGTAKPVILYSFNGFDQNDGYEPLGGVAIGADGTLYGITEFGGSPDNDGEVFAIGPGGAETKLYAFSGIDGRGPHGGLVVDSDGSLVGSTAAGGLYDSGTVWRMSQGMLTTLYDFKGGADGSGPGSLVVIDSSENIYGTTGAGGHNKKGILFELSPGETILHVFGGPHPSGGPLMDAAGNLYGATNLSAGKAGDVFEVSGR